MDKAALESLAALIEKTDPAKAALIRQHLDGGPREGLAISVNIACQLQKFDGDYAPGKTPVETITLS